MNTNDFIEELLTELSYRSKEGYPDFKKSEHIQIMSEILDEWGLSDIKDNLINNIISEAPEEEEETNFNHPVLNKEVEYEDSEGNRKTGKVGNLLRQPEDTPPREAAEAELNGLSDEERQEIDNELGSQRGNQTDPDMEFDGEKDDEDGSGEEQGQPDTGTSLKPDNPAGQDYYDSLPDDDPAKKANKPKLSDTGETLTSDFTERYESSKEYLDKDKQELMDTALEKISVLYAENRSEEQKKEAAKWLKDEMKFSTNTNGKKAYLNALGGFRKIISGTAGTVKSEQLVKTMKEYTDIKEYNASSVKTKLTTAAKPDLGKENEFSPKKHERVQKFFTDNPITERIPDRLWGVFGVKDENGDIMMPSSTHAKEYLKQSFDNPALERTIKAAREEVKNDNIDKGVVNAMEDHQKRLKSIISEYNIPSDEAVEAINESYNDMMVGLNKADSDIASSIMKQLAENRLYEVELANGEEVYLPSHGSFPGGDKIKVGGLERVSLVSCKFGKQGRTYGCPANAKSVTGLHPNSEKRENQGQYLGEDGYTLLIKDELIKGSTTEESVQKTKDFITSTLEEVELSDTFNDEELDKIANITTNFGEEVEKIREDLDDDLDATTYWDLFNKRVTNRHREVALELGQFITDEHLSKLVGENNASNLKRRTDGSVDPEVLLGAIEIANNIRTSGGYGLEHNKQYYDDEGAPKFVTDKGSVNPNDYSITSRSKRTKGRAGGGIQLSQSGDGEVPDTMLEDDGFVTDTKTGETVETY